MYRADVRLIWLVVLMANLLIGGRAESVAPGTVPMEPGGLERLVAQLGSDSFATRGRAEARLIEFASSGEEAAERVKTLLRVGSLPAKDLELYLSKQRLLGRLELRDQQIELERFLYDPSFDHRKVVGWEQFCSSAGEDLDARLVYFAIVKDRPEIGRMLAAMEDNSTACSEIDGIDRHDIATWSAFLSMACRRKRMTADGATMRLTAMLSSPAAGPEAMRDHERRVLTHLVGSYLSSAPIDLRDRLVIGLRYDCDSMVEADCRRVLSDPTESPSRIVTAMLAASKLNFSPAETNNWIESFSHDFRVSHVWRSMVPPKTTHRTQVRDVAFALKLHRSGIDPRTRGFSALVADPILVFQPCSLGFKSEASRRQSHAND